MASSIPRFVGHRGGRKVAYTASEHADFRVGSTKSFRVYNNDGDDVLLEVADGDYVRIGTDVTLNLGDSSQTKLYWSSALGTASLEFPGSEVNGLYINSDGAGGPIDLGTRGGVMELVAQSGVANPDGSSVCGVTLNNGSGTGITTSGEGRFNAFRVLLTGHADDTDVATYVAFNADTAADDGGSANFVAFRVAAGYGVGLELPAETPISFADPAGGAVSLFTISTLADSQSLEIALAAASDTDDRFVRIRSSANGGSGRHGIWITDSATTIWFDEAADEGAALKIEIIANDASPFMVADDAGDEFLAFVSTTGSKVAAIGGENVSVQVGAHASTKVGFFAATPVVQQSALTAADGGTVDGTYGAEEASVIQNLVTRQAEIETLLQAYGLLPAP